MKKQKILSSFSVGFVIFVGMLLFMAGLFVVGDGVHIFSEQVEYKLIAPNATGIQVGSKVYLSGVHAGSVKRIRFPADLTSSQVILLLSMDREYREGIRANSFAYAMSEGVLGDQTIHIQLGTADQPALGPGSEIPFKQRSMLEGLAGEQFTQSTENLLETTISILREIQAGKGTVGQLLKNPELYDNLNNFMKATSTIGADLEGMTADVKSAVAAIRDQKGMLGKVIFSEDYARNFETILGETSELVKSLRSISKDIEDEDGSLGKLLSDPSLHDNAVKTLDGLQRVAARLDDLLARASEGKSILGTIALDSEAGGDFKGLLAKLERSADSLEKILKLVNEGEGSLGMLVHDPSIVASIRDVFLGVKEMGLVQGVVRNAERMGREAYLRDSSFALREEEEVRRARALARIRQDAGSGSGESGLDAEGKPVPAAGSTGGSPRPLPTGGAQEGP